MAMATKSFGFTGLSSLYSSHKIEFTKAHPWRSNLSIQSKGSEHSQNDGVGRRRIWRRRKLTKKDEMMEYKLERVPFLEEQVRKIRDNGQLVGMDIEWLKLSEENRFDFVNKVAAEANQLVENNRDEYGGEKKAILHAISIRMNEAGFDRPDAYVRTDDFKPGPGYRRVDLL